SRGEYRAAHGRRLPRGPGLSTTAETRPSRLNRKTKRPCVNVPTPQLSRIPLSNRTWLFGTSLTYLPVGQPFTRYTPCGPNESWKFRAHGAPPLIADVTTYFSTGGVEIALSGATEKAKAPRSPPSRVPALRLADSIDRSSWLMGAASNPRWSE